MEVPIQITEDKQHRHAIIIPKNVWNAMELHEGDWLLVDFKIYRRGASKKG